MELREALTQITEIRLQLARTEVFRGYRAMPVAFSGGVAVLAAVIQAATIADPAVQIGPYLALWIGAAVVSGLAAGLEMMIRARNAASTDDPRADLAGARAILPVPDRRSAGDDRAASGRAGESLDAARPLADLLQPGDLRLLPAACPGRRSGWPSSTWGPVWLCWPWRMARRRFLPGRWACPSERASCWPPPCFIAPWSAIMPQPKAKSSESNGRFAYDGLERVFHEKARLGIMTSLVSQPRGVVFADLKELCHLTDGNLSRHLQVLNEAGFVEIWKGFHKNRPQTLCRITDEGRRRFLRIHQRARDRRPRRPERRSRPHPSPAPARSTSPRLVAGLKSSIAGTLTRRYGICDIFLCITKYLAKSTDLLAAVRTRVAARSHRRGRRHACV